MSLFNALDVLALSFCWFAATVGFRIENGYIVDQPSDPRGRVLLTYVNNTTAIFALLLVVTELWVQKLYFSLPVIIFSGYWAAWMAKKYPPHSLKALPLTLFAAVSGVVLAVLALFSVWFSV
jgi:hypothetical protein